MKMVTNKLNRLAISVAASDIFDAKLVLKQLTGRNNPINTLVAMIGASNFVSGGNDISFKFKMCRKANILKIEYDSGSDMYNMVFYRNGSEVKRFDQVFNDGMKEIFERFTGLRLNLF